MNDQSSSADIKVLVDLKPALDGYAGIPQESRLLFRGLSAMAGFRVEGLIQHGGTQLRPALKSGGRVLSEAKRINRLSRFVISLYEKPHGNLFDLIRNKLDKHFARQWIEIKALFGVRLRLTRFPSALFDDFVWRTFFSKTLNPADKAALTGIDFRVLTPSRHMLHKAGMAALRLGGAARYPVVDTAGFDYLVTQTPFPGRTGPGCRMVVRYHDAVPILMPHTISDKSFHQASHFHALKDNVAQGAWFSCISEATRADLLKIFPEVESRSSVIYNIVSNEYFVDGSYPEAVMQIVRTRSAIADLVKSKLPVSEKGQLPQQIQYLLMVSTIEPRKNHLLLMQAWERLKYGTFGQLKIIFVGGAGWDHAPVLKAFQPWAERGELYWLNNVPSSELRTLYRHAMVTVCPGLAEGFDYSGVEAMQCDGIVASSDIPVHREIYQDASVFFDPYDVEDAAAVIARLLHSSAQRQREELRAAGRRVSRLYSAEVIMPQWQAFLQSLESGQAQPGGSRAGEVAA